MTVEEAIRCIDDVLDSDVHWDESIDYKLMSIDVDWLGKSREALEKQMSKKPIPFKRTAHDFCNGVCEHSHYPCEHLKIYNHEYQYTDYKCPLCNKRVSDGNPNNCCHCGQALDWSDAECVGNTNF